MNNDLTGKTVRFLSHSDSLKSSDYCRLVVQTGDDGGFNTTYKPNAYNPMRWQHVSEELPAWIGRKISEFSYHTMYEYVRERYSDEVSKYLPKEDATMTDCDLKYRIEEEGFGYTLQHYCRYSDIKSKETRELFGKAYDAMIDLLEHLGVEK